MLVLSRKTNERIIVDHDITVTVVRIHRNRVKLGIDAPGEVSVHRQEIAAAVVRDQNHRDGNRTEVESGRSSKFA